MAQRLTVAAVLEAQALAVDDGRELRLDGNPQHQVARAARQRRELERLLDAGEGGNAERVPSPGNLHDFYILWAEVVEIARARYR